MRRGFTLLELMVVIIILGVLATLGVMQYQAAIERARGAEARQVLGQLRTQCAAVYMQDGTTANCTAGNMGIGVDIPGDTAADCAATHFFSYGSIPAGAGSPDAIQFGATRCPAGGKTPQGASGNWLRLDVDYAAGTDVWTSVGGY